MMGPNRSLFNSRTRYWQRFGFTYAINFRSVFTYSSQMPVCVADVGLACMGFTRLGLASIVGRSLEIGLVGELTGSPFPASFASLVLRHLILVCDCIDL